MHRRRLILLALPLALLFVLGAIRNPEVAPSGEVIFFDDFDTQGLDRTRWNVIGPRFWVNNEQQAYVDSSATLYVEPREGAENGALILQPRFSPGFVTPTGRTTDFISGRVDTRGKVSFTYGKAEARIRMPDAAGVWPAWWLLGSGRWPDSGEIDIMEYVGERDWIGVALHGPGYSGATPLVNKYFFADGEDVTGWHVYAVDWSEDQLDFLVDDRLVYRVTRPMVEHYGAWRFDNPKYLILNFAVGGTYPFNINGIREPYNGIPESTVEAIKEGRVAMEVDWVRVTAPGS